jgi:hypothetical protein
VNPVDFLIALWGSAPPAGQLIQIWELERRRSSYLRAPIGAAGLEGRHDLYTAVALVSHRSNLGPRQRARADQATAIAGLWLDADVDGGPDGKTGAIPDQPTAATLTEAIAPPTLLVSSGYGVQAWWLLDEPWRFSSRDEQSQGALMSAQWHALHRAVAQARGWGLDHTHDLARLLRLPGTINAKGGTTAPVTVLTDGGPRYTRTELAERCATAGDVVIETSAGDIGTGGALPDIVARDPRVDPDRLEALLFNVPEFARSWTHGRGDGWSLSEYDLSIATHAAQAGWADQQIADLIAHHRRLWNPGDPKASRRDYLRRTIAKARDTGQRTSAAKRLAEIVHGTAA